MSTGFYFFSSVSLQKGDTFPFGPWVDFYSDMEHQTRTLDLMSGGGGDAYGFQYFFPFQPWRPFLIANVVEM